MAKTFKVEVTVPEGLKAGDTFEIEVEAPVKEKAPRGQLAGIALEDMTIEQLKREKINASSVLYKAKQRGASDETIAKNQARVDAVCARLAEVAPPKPKKEKEAPVETECSDEVASAPIADETVYDEEAASEM